ncbi:MAG TPA: hypothetical protein VGE07_02770 [Herpetosiphonaceae bacterium]
MYESPPPAPNAKWLREPEDPWLTRAEAIAWTAVSLSAWMACCWQAIGYNDACHGPGASYPGACQGGGEYRIWGGQLASLAVCLLLMWLFPIGRFARGLLLGLYAALVYLLPFGLAWLFIL